MPALQILLKAQLLKIGIGRDFLNRGEFHKVEPTGRIFTGRETRAAEDAQEVDRRFVACVFAYRIALSFSLLGHARAHPASGWKGEITHY